MSIPRTHLPNVLRLRGCYLFGVGPIPLVMIMTLTIAVLSVLSPAMISQGNGILEEHKLRILSPVTQSWENIGKKEPLLLPAVLCQGNGERSMKSHSSHRYYLPGAKEEADSYFYIMPKPLRLLTRL